jgi:hypothetical protein
MKPSESDLDKAREILGSCTCGFLEGFNWDGIHDKYCVIKAVAQALAEKEAEVIERCAEIADDKMGVIAHKAYEIDPYASRASLIGPMIAKEIRHQGRK